MDDPKRLAQAYWPADESEALLDVSLGELLRQQAREHPERTALVDGVGPAHSRRRWTYAELLATAEGLAGCLLSRYAPGDRIAVFAAGSPEWVLVQYAVGLAGMSTGARSWPLWSFRALMLCRRRRRCSSTAASDSRATRPLCGGISPTLFH
jgi:fatty-acyl-CoA synthase